ncbi:MAG TPA: NAD(P)H-dependent oxidoreductase [Parabacteroides johnsonii]|jgi:hypothetical protein|uniref:NAD(P)H-dependent oxidoreductase n=1 Tax=Parabacteroides johnsonii TaxID=387661 RepID=UPI001DC1B31C|nr:NAD(P)H-dependent oxidoreductase [Parabacteroides johnsonii]HJG98068.1 NAD(P)H-dependent oxidoreductase [Parabacteroides johnsonii]
MKKILILSAHPDIEKSKACSAMLNAVKGLDNVKVIDIYKVPLKVENYIDDVKHADVLVFQFPFWWGSAPAMLKNWLDTFMLGFLENPGMKGKSLLIATAAGVSEEDYHPGGAEQFTVDEILRPYQVTAIYSGMTYLKPFVLYGTMTPDAEQRICKGAKDYKSLIETL